MKILFFSPCLYETGGVSRVLSLISSELSRYNDVEILTLENEKFKKNKIYHLSPKIKVSYLNPIERTFLQRVSSYLNSRFGYLKKIKIKKLWDWTYISPKIQKELIGFINNGKFDAVCGVHAECAYYIGSIKEYINCKTIGWQHSSFDAYFRMPGKYYWNRDFLFHKYVKLLDHYIVLNEYDEERYRTEMNINTITIYNPKSFVSEKKSECKNKRFIACGSLKKVKGYDMLIDSFEIFSQTDQEWCLDIFGDGEERVLLQNKIVSKNLQNRIFLHGNVDNIADKMLNSSALLLSSRWEGMPMVVLEALECGLPIITYNITAIKPLVTNGIEGLITECFNIDEYSNHMSIIARDEKVRCSMSSNAVKKANLFELETIGKQWNNILRK